MRSPAITFLLTAIAFSAAGALPAETPLQFNRDVRPILAERCYSCHGPDASRRQSNLRLDQKESAHGARKRGPAVTPGRREQSQLSRRIHSSDPEEVMPPAKTGVKLSAKEIALLDRWIDEGGAYQGHWSFIPPRAPPAPEVRRESWARNDLDRFILHRLEREGLEPAPEAERTTLIRRATFDLTGLPPSLAEIDAFLADERPGAYERLVERLLSSPRYGERLALEWLDASRYADTHGYHIDSGRDMTRWRDWVIRAFNDNLPFDRFVVEQLAGDLLPNATMEQRIASGFHRNHMINFEGGAIPEEYHNAYIVDRVNTTATVFLGLTLACAQCHDHKYDPFTQKEFYQLYAFFHNIEENGLDGNRGNAVPYLPVPTPEQSRRLEELAASTRELEKRMDGPLADADQAQGAWEEAAARGEGPPRWAVLEPNELHAAGGTELSPQGDGSVLAGGKNPEKEAFSARFESAPRGATALRLEALTDPSLPGGGPGRFENSNFVLSELEAEAVAASGEAKRLAFRAARADFAQPGFGAAKAIDGDPATGWGVDNAPRKETRTAIFVFAEPLALGDGAKLRVRMRFESPFAGHVIGRFRLSATTAAGGGLEMPKEILELVRKPAAERSEEERRKIRRHFRGFFSAAYRALETELQGLRKAREEVDRSIPTAMVMKELEKPRDTFLLVRGQYDRKGEKVEANVPAALPPLPAGAPRNRLSLARWLVDPAQPLTARVIVNRYWQMYFGAGIVKTVEDFGSQGEWPVHPELLDWLAARFVASGWDVKELQRLIVTSAAYRQASVVSAEKLERDPENRLLARGPRFRLPAEFIRDQALRVSGLLDGRIGGASVSPYQPAGLWEELMSREDGANWSAQTYSQSHGPDLYRRSMYTYWKRTCPPPTMTTFDAPDRETCSVRRGRTNTPLQALILMNDPTYLESARKLAERIMTEPPAGIPERLAFAFRLLTARRPTAEEGRLLEGLVRENLEHFRAEKGAALALLSWGESPRSEALDPAELAAWTMVASALLNLDETVTKG